MHKYSDFRSDTVTRPTEKMRKAMADAVVGDDVLGDDPTVQELEALASSMTQKEAALYMPSGTMANSVAAKVWTQELDEVILEERSHFYNMESTSLTFIARVLPRPLPSDRGAMDPAEIERNIKLPSDHHPRTSLICVENTHNNWGGAVVPISNLKAIREVADRHDVKIHFDGARLFNASQVTGVPVHEYAAIGDSLMFCLSKGLSAPVGSVLVGPSDFIRHARRIRKALGGGMRQAGILAA
ncbi:MAG: threonine aldolase family protein, partial [Candidatus Aminicenantes bacterium]|nr:threonine aldolase family protein [Candidatus Aminicenantes bacterium]